MHAQRRPLADGDGLFLDHAGEAAIAWSGGSEPGDQVNRAAVEAMKERGIDISGEYPKPWTDEIVRAADVVITMGCGDACPVFPGKRYEEWTLDDPAGLEVADVRPIRDEIERRVLVLPRCVAPVADAAHPGACVAETHHLGAPRWRRRSLCKFTAALRPTRAYPRARSLNACPAPPRG